MFTYFGYSPLAGPARRVAVASAMLAEIALVDRYLVDYYEFTEDQLLRDLPPRPTMDRVGEFLDLLPVETVRAVTDANVVLASVLARVMGFRRVFGGDKQGNEWAARICCIETMEVVEKARDLLVRDGGIWIDHAPGTSNMHVYGVLPSLPARYAKLLAAAWGDERGYKLAENAPVRPVSEIASPARDLESS